jgi:DNA-binding transcriptional LysR family regulator
MELRHLRYFVAVAEELHFGRAARRLHMAQPPLSQQIMAFETELGVKLFERTKRKVELSVAGKAMLEEARKTLVQAAAAEQSARDAHAGKAGRLKVAFVVSSSYTILPELLRRHRAAHPGIRLDLAEMTPAGQMEALDQGQLDVGLMRLPVPETCYLAARLIDEALVVALPRGHALAKARVVALSRLATEPFILFQRMHGPGIHDAIIGACHAAGFSPRAAHEANEMQAILGYVAGGLGVALVPCSLTEFHRKEIVYRPIKPRVQVSLAAVARQGETDRNVHDFIALARAVGAEWQRRFRTRVG